MKIGIILGGAGIIVAGAGAGVATSFIMKNKHKDVDTETTIKDVEMTYSQVDTTFVKLDDDTFGKTISNTGYTMSDDIGEATFNEVGIMKGLEPNVLISNAIQGEKEGEYLFLLKGGTDNSDKFDEFTISNNDLISKSNNDVMGQVIGTTNKDFSKKWGNISKDTMKGVTEMITFNLDKGSTTQGTFSIYKVVKAEMLDGTTYDENGAYGYISKTGDTLTEPVTKPTTFTKK